MRLSYFKTEDYFFRNVKIDEELENVKIDEELEQIKKIT